MLNELASIAELVVAGDRDLLVKIAPANFLDRVGHGGKRVEQAPGEAHGSGKRNHAGQDHQKEEQPHGGGDILPDGVSALFRRGLVRDTQFIAMAEHLHGFRAQLLGRLPSTCVELARRADERAGSPCDNRLRSGPARR